MQPGVSLNTMTAFPKLNNDQEANVDYSRN